MDELEEQNRMYQAALIGCTAAMIKLVREEPERIREKYETEVQRLEDLRSSVEQETPGLKTILDSLDGGLEPSFAIIEDAIREVEAGTSKYSPERVAAHLAQVNMKIGTFADLHYNTLRDDPDY